MAVSSSSCCWWGEHVDGKLQKFSFHLNPIPPGLFEGGSAWGGGGGGGGA